jgi:DNA modification methylase
LEVGLRQIPIIVLNNLSEAQHRALAIADNQLALLSDWDEEKLRKQLALLSAEDFNLDLLGFEDVELQHLLQAQTENPFCNEDEVPDRPAVIITRPGDLWLLPGRKQCAHRFLCGDATRKVDVDRLIKGQPPPLLMVTDPPFGVSLDPEWREELGLNKGTRQSGKVANDDRSDWSEAWALFPGDVAYVWHAGIHATKVDLSLQSCDFEIRAQLIWAKQHFVISRGAYHWQHEPCWYAVRKGRNANWRGDRKQTTMWNVANLNPFGGESASENEPCGHSTQKPVEIMRRPIVNHTRPGDTVYDPFLGSGSTLIAAESIGRLCFAIEIDPGHADMSVLRWQRYTGRKAVLDGDRRTFDQIAKSRKGNAA